MITLRISPPTFISFIIHYDIFFLILQNLFLPSSCLCFTLNTLIHTHVHAYAPREVLIYTHTYTHLFLVRKLLFTLGVLVIGQIHPCWNLPSFYRIVFVAIKDTELALWPDSKHFVFILCDGLWILRFSYLCAVFILLFLSNPLKIPF